jgi:hypothetical protein
MRLFGFGFLVIAVTAVSACNSSPATNSSAAAHGGSGRYLGIGVYPASDLWQHLAATDRPRDASMRQFERPLHRDESLGSAPRPGAGRAGRARSTYGRLAARAGREQYNRDRGSGAT